MAISRSIKSENKIEYDAWRSMKQRCRDIKRNPTYAKTKVCQRWESFDNFLLDMGKRPAPGYSIDRIDNQGNYEPSNCRWATLEEQNHNKSNNLWITINGESKTLADWSRISGLTHGVIVRRIRIGWPESRWLEPAREQKKVFHPREHISWKHMLWNHLDETCERWKKSFDNFYRDMGPIPGPKYGLSRINVKVDYCPENCEWTTKFRDSKRQSKRIITKDGITKTVAEWAVELNISEGTINSRIYKIKYPESRWLEPVNRKK